MAAKEVVCGICGETVSKRQSLAFADGRACRSHEEVIQMLEDKAQGELDKKLMASADEMMKIITLTSFVRCTHSLHGIPLVVLYARIRQTYGRETLNKVIAAVEEQGAMIDYAEMAAGLMAHAELVKRATRASGD